jgi:hypothetical protein
MKKPKKVNALSLTIKKLSMGPVFLLSFRKYDMGRLSRILDPRVKKHWIPDPDQQHCFSTLKFATFIEKRSKFSITLGRFQRSGGR